jgi:hypothetical protein
LVHGRTGGCFWDFATRRIIDPEVLSLHLIDSLHRLA